MTILPDIIYRHILSYVVINDHEKSWEIDELIRVSLVCWKWHALVSVLLRDRQVYVQGLVNAKECISIFNDPVRSRYCLLKSITRLYMSDLLVSGDTPIPLSDEEKSQIHQHLESITFKKYMMSYHLLHQPIPSLKCIKMKYGLPATERIPSRLVLIDYVTSKVERIHANDVFYHDASLQAIKLNKFPNLTSLTLNEFGDVSQLALETLSSGLLNKLKRITLKSIKQSYVGSIIQSLQKSTLELEEIGIISVESIKWITCFQEYVATNPSIKSVKLGTAELDQLSDLSTISHIKELSIDHIATNQVTQPVSIRFDLDKLTVYYPSSLKSLTIENQGSQTPPKEYCYLSPDSNIRNIRIVKGYLVNEFSFLNEFIKQNQSLESISINSSKQHISYTPNPELFEQYANKCLEVVTQSPSLQIIKLSGPFKSLEDTNLYTTINNNFNLISICNKTKTWKR